MWVSIGGKMDLGCHREKKRAEDEESNMTHTQVSWDSLVNAVQTGYVQHYNNSGEVNGNNGQQCSDPEPQSSENLI